MTPYQEYDYPVFYNVSFLVLPSMDQYTSIYSSSKSVDVYFYNSTLFYTTYHGEDCSKYFFCSSTIN